MEPATERTCVVSGPGASAEQSMDLPYFAHIIAEIARRCFRQRRGDRTTRVVVAVPLSSRRSSATNGATPVVKVARRS